MGDDAICSQNCIVPEAPGIWIRLGIPLSKGDLYDPRGNAEKDGGGNTFTRCICIRKPGCLPHVLGMHFHAPTYFIYLRLAIMITL